MKRLYFRRKVFTLLIGIAALFLLGALESDAQEEVLTTFSGRVIDEAGHPIAGLTVVLVPVADRMACFTSEISQGVQRYR